MNESTILKQIWAALSQSATLFRNNVGVAFQPNGQVIKYGLCKGSSDLIGWRPIDITQDMVGKTIAQFIAVEVKTKTGRPTKEQINFLHQLDKAGGCAILAKSPEDAEKQMKGHKNV